MEEARGVMQAMESGARLGLEVSKEVLELVFRFITFIIERYERSKEFKMKYGDMNKEQKMRRNGYLSAKKMKQEMESRGESVVPVNFGDKKMTDAEMDKLERYSKLMDFPYMYIEEPVLDKHGNPVLDEHGEPKTKRTFFVLQSDMDKMVIFLEILNRDKQHEDIDKSDLSEEQKEQMHKDVDMEASYEQNEDVAQKMASDRTEFYDAMKQACENGDFSHLEEMIKNENIQFYSNNDEKSGFTAVMNKNARRDYAKGESYFVVDAKNPTRFVELTSERNDKQNRTDTTYKVYENDELVLKTDDKISDDIAQENDGWNPNWNDIREEIANAGNFKENGHYFVFSSKQEFDAYRTMFDNNIEQFTINPEKISVDMDYSKAKDDIVSQMKTNDFYNQNVAKGNEFKDISMGDVNAAKLSADQISSLGTLEKLDYQIFANNMEQYATLNRLEEIASSIEAKQTEIAEMNLDDPIAAMEKNGKLSDEIATLKNEHEIYSKYLGSLAEQEKSLLSAHSEEITEEKTKNRDASKLLTEYRAMKVMKESNLDVSEFSKEQKEEIKQGLAHGLNVSQVKSYMNKEMTPEQMKLCRTGLEKGLKNTQLEHVVETYTRTNNFEIAADAMTAYKAGLDKKQVELIADEALTSQTRGQFIEACREKVDMEKLEVVKQDVLAHKDNLLTVRTSALLQIANNKDITKEDMSKLCGLKNEHSLEEIKNALDKGLSIKELEPVMKDDITPEQVKGVSDILLSEKKSKSKEKKEKTPSKEQFKKAHEWAQEQNAKADNGRDRARENTRENAKATPSGDER